jgi:dTDP-4-amino-4,6-dideoxygalactose transaminase
MFDTDVNQTPIPQTDPRAGYLAQRTEIDAAIRRVLDGGQYILGPEAEALERAFAEWLGVAHAIGTGSDTDAIELALRACGIGAGDLVFTVSHTAVATVAAIERAGAVPVLVNIEPGGFTMAPTALEAALRQPPPGRPAATLPVHLYGEPADLATLLEIPRAHGLRVIEDCAQSHGAPYRGRMAGSFGDFACSAFIPQKTLGRSATPAWSRPATPHSPLRHAKSASMAGASVASVRSPASTPDSTRSRRRS